MHHFSSNWWDILQTNTWYGRISLFPIQGGSWCDWKSLMQVLTGEIFLSLSKFAAPLKPFRYTIDIKINASREAVIERLRTLILGQKFPMCIKKGMKISGANITTGRRIISVTGVMPFCPHYSENYFYMGSLILSYLLNLQFVFQIQTKFSVSVRINMFGPLINALNMAFVAQIKMIPADASLLFQLTGRSAGHHLVKKSLFI